MTNWFIGELIWSRMSQSIQARRDIRVVLWLRPVVPEVFICPINDTRHTVLILQAIYWIRDLQLQCINPNVTKYGASLDVCVSPKKWTKIHIHYIHSVVVQYVISGRACCVNQYHYKSRKRRVVMRFVHTTGKTWYKVLYQQTMYVISVTIENKEERCLSWTERFLGCWW